MKDYKKILEGVVNIINTTEKSDIGFANICTYIGESCPELKESESEKIRKVLVELVKCNEKSGYFMFNNITTSSMLAWLEKQGEQKPAIEMKSAEESLGIDSETYNKIVDECIYGEQKSVDKVEPNKKFTPIESVLKDLICDVDNSYTIEQVRRFLFEYGYKDKILNAAQEEMQRPAAWSEEDEERLKSCLNVLQARGIMEDTETVNTKWLKSLKERVLPQSKQECSDKDKKMVHHLENAIKYDKPRTYLNSQGIEITDVCDWLKSLRPQKQWKPSDEQIAALSDINLTGNISYPGQGQELINLYIDLKKLKGE